MEKIKVFIVEDHQMVIDGFTTLLENTGDFQIVGSAKNSTQLFPTLQNVEVDVMLLDIELEDGEYAYDFLGKLKELYPEIKVLMVTQNNDIEIVGKYLDEGADGYVIKNVNISDLCRAIKEVHDGKTFLSEKMRDEYLAYTKNRDEKFDESVIASPSLKEKEVIILISQELTSQEIANRMFISKNTVETHRKNLFKKLRVKNSIGLVKYAIKTGLI